MANSYDDMERKFSVEQKVSNEILSYNLAEPRITDLETMKEGLGIQLDLVDAIVAGNLEELKKILQDENIGVNAKFGRRHFVNHWFPSNGTLLMLAAKHGQTMIVNFLLNQPGIDVSSKDSLGMTALDYALLDDDYHCPQNANYAIARNLIKAGADINAKDGSLLMKAWVSNNPVAANKFLIWGANICLSDAGADIFRKSMNNRDWSSNIDQQMALSKKWADEDHVKCVGIDIERLCCTYMTTDVGQKIAECLFGQNSLGMRGFNVGTTLIRQRLVHSQTEAQPATDHQTSPSNPLTFLRNLHSDVYNQKYVSRDKGQDQFSHDKKHGYAPGPGMMDTP